MERVYIEQTKLTPKIQFDPEKHTLKMEGQSYPENAFTFYKPVLLWLDAYLAESDQPIVLEIYFHIPYINASSSKCIMMVLEKLENAYRNGKRVSICWYYSPEDDTAVECAKTFKEDLLLPFAITLRAWE